MEEEGELDAVIMEELLDAKLEQAAGPSVDCLPAIVGNVPQLALLQRSSQQADLADLLALQHLAYDMLFEVGQRLEVAQEIGEVDT